VTLSTEGNDLRLKRLQEVHTVEKFVLCDPVIFLTRNNKECLLTNGRHLDPLYFSEGKDFVVQFLNDLSVNGSRSLLAPLHPDYERLIDLFLAFNILNSGSTENQEDICPKSKSFPLGEDGFALYLLLTQFCNLSCIYCLNGDITYQKKSKLKMPEDIAFKAVNFFSKRLNEGANGEIILFGGEPLLNWETAKNVTRYCESELKSKIKGKLSYHLTSNLASIPPDLVSWGKEYNAGILCDIDGPEELHDKLRPFINGKGSFSRISPNIRKLVSEGFELTLRATITSHNVKSMVQIAQTHKDLGGRRTAFVPVMPITSDECALPLDWYPDPQVFADGLLDVLKSGIYKINDISPISEMLRDLLIRENLCCCGAPFGNTPVVDVNGDIYPCIYYVGLERLKIGNVQDPDNLNLAPLHWLSEKTDIDRNESCGDCEYRFLCHGGCPASWITAQASGLSTPEAIGYGRSVACAVKKTIIPFLLWYLVENPGVIDESEMKRFPC